MATFGFPFDNVEYEASELGAWLCTRTRGVFSGEDHYSVTIDGALSVSVSAGVAWLKMSEQWGIVAANPAPISLPITGGDGSLNRMDAVCLRVNKNTSAMELVVKEGMLAASPEIPEIERNLDYDEVYLATLFIPSGTLELTNDLLTDQRLNEDYCGLMRDGVTGIPTQQLQAQAEALMDSLRGEIAGINAASEMMLKTEYAFDAIATIESGILSVVSTFGHPQTTYDVRFMMPSGEFSSMTIDGVAMTGVYGTDGEITDFEPAEGVPVTLTRQDDRAFFKSGGAGYAFRLYAVTALPATAREKDLAVLTDAAITDWTFSAQQPTGAEGMVWIKTGVTSPVAFNALKKNSLLVYPLACYQYTGGVWISKRAFLYTSGAWAEFGFNFYDSGVFGGGATGATITGGSSTLQAAYIDLLVYSSSEAFYRSTVSLTPKIDVTELNTLRFTLDAVAWSTTIKNYDAVTVGLMNNLSNTEAFVASIGTRLETAGIVLTIDVSARTGEYYLAARVSGYGTGHATNYRIRKIEGV